MLSLEEALDRILSTAEPLGGESFAVHEADGRISSKRVLAPLDLPPFDNSAMDGYAVRAPDLESASTERPVSLRVCGQAAAGVMFDGSVAPGCCVRVFTGSPLPQGADAVVMQEDTKADSTEPDSIQVLDRVRPWENVRLRGEDVKAGAALIEAGERIGAASIGLLSATGLATIVVGRRPVVGILATGSELADAGSPLEPGKIHDSNRPMLAALVTRTGGAPIKLPRVRDSIDETTAALRHGLDQCDVLITSGGVSVGEFDFLRNAFRNLGGSVDFWQVAMKPGKPFVSGRLGSKHLFGLPGNPVSAFVTFAVLVRPALLRLQGSTDLTLPTSQGELVEPFSNSGDRRHFMRVRIDSSGRVHSAGIQASHVLTSLAKANGLVDVPPQSKFDAGAIVTVLRLD
jgi:molybdopterin molybdotransferase